MLGRDAADRETKGSADLGYCRRIFTQLIRGDLQRYSRAGLLDGRQTTAKALQGVQIRRDAGAGVRHLDRRHKRVLSHRAGPGGRHMVHRQAVAIAQLAQHIAVGSQLRRRQADRRRRAGLHNTQQAAAQRVQGVQVR